MFDIPIKDYDLSVWEREGWHVEEVSRFSLLPPFWVLQAISLD
jgi:hypothetical protein